MIDTVKVGFHGTLKENSLSKWFTYQRHGFKETYRRTLNGTDNQKIIATYHKLDMGFKNNSLILFEFSAPKLIYNCNHKLIQDLDLDKVISQSNALIQGFSEFSNLSIQDGALYRVDFCCNHFVGDHAEAYINSLRLAHYPHRKVFPYQHEGVQFRSGEVSSQFYIKELECKHLETYGWIRQEVSYRKRDRIQSLCSTNHPTINDLTKELSRKVLEKDLRRLHLEGVLIAPSGVALSALIATYGSTKGNNLYGHWCQRQRYTVNELIKIHKCSKANIIRKESDIAKAGIAVIGTDSLKLPPLKVIL